ncbi:DHHC palmitoyltransferase-domain-containing protein [Leucosporidium creatinivorum]|uniref:Palmitoyltransferase n=1 Tax=Leucosporidium creatinivorum TaxID=106004 RepID=A0A1Y2F8Q9_9BASI|nr:DHHC palmitoyltransferase-domain-containing protein [Leucosporidium creatinivorum]
MGRLAGRLWVSGTLLLISFIGFSSQLWIIWPSYHSRLSRQLLELLVPFNFLLSLLFYNYYLCVVTNPGNVPQNWTPNERDEDRGVEVKKLTGGPRYCRTCRAYKPPRAHHCRKCKTCVLKMDHHCPWVNNCVGHANYGHFIRFLFMVDVACTYHLWMITKRAFGTLAFATHPTTLQVVMLILNYTACVPVLMAVGMFSLYHFWCLLMNTTTIEGWEKDKVATLRRKGKILEFRYPYHLGFLANVQSVLGRNPIFWCWPQKRAPGDGLYYPVGKGVGKLVASPPRRGGGKAKQSDYEDDGSSSEWSSSEEEEGEEEKLVQ